MLINNTQKEYSENKDMSSKGNLINSYSIYEYQIGGRTLMLKSNDNTKVLKKIIEINQLRFYQYMQSLHASHPHYSLNYFISKYLRFMDLQQQLADESYLQLTTHANPKIKKWLEFIKNKQRNIRQSHNIYIQMQNFSYSYKNLNILDVKVGKMPNHEDNKFCVQKNLKITGILKNNSKGESQFGTRYQTEKVKNNQQMKQIFAYFFINQYGTLQIDKIIKSINTLQNLSLVLRSFKGWNFKSSSVCFLYDASQEQKCEIKYIDFGKLSINQLNQSYDEYSISGLTNLIVLLKQIVKDKQKYTKIDINFQSNEFAEHTTKNKKQKVIVSNENQLRQQLTKMTEKI